METDSSECNRADPLLGQSEDNSIFIKVEKDDESDMSTSSGTCIASSVINMDLNESSSIDPVAVCDEQPNVKLEDNKESVVFLPEMIEHKEFSEEMEYTKNETDPLETNIEENTIFIKVENDEESAVCSEETAEESAKLITNMTRGEIDDKTQMVKNELKFKHCMHNSPDCETCIDTFHRNIDLERSPHELTFPCDMCNKAFTSEAVLQRHQLVHICQRSFACDMCNKVFTRKTYLQRHQHLVHTGQHSFVCGTCNKVFNSSEYLKRHEFVHTGQRSFVCDVCNKAFTCKAVLQRHQLIHSGERSFVCDTCNKAFTCKDILQKHQLVHIGHRSFVCATCNKAFSCNDYLKSHQLIHTGQRSFVCDTCNKAFTRNSDFKRHKLIHTGKRSFVCDTCKKAFTRNSSLKRHPCNGSRVRKM